MMKTESIDEEDNVAEEEAKQKEIDEAKIEKEAKEDAEFESTIFVVKVTNRKEQNAFELIGERVRKKKLDVYAIAAPHGLTGYLFLEAADRKNAEEAVYNLSYVKQILPTITSYSEIKPMLEPVTEDIKIEKNDIVEIISNDFKKEKAKVVRVDKTKGEVVVSLLAAVVPIPVTLPIDNVRVIRREESEDDLEE
jgi:transcriptional antiterminator NusG